MTRRAGGRKKPSPPLRLPPIYGQADWAAKLLSHTDRNLAARTRLVKCIWLLFLNKPLDRSDSKWVTEILVDVVLGNDLLPRFRVNSAGGAAIKPDDHKFYIALDALVTSAASGIKGKVLWGVLAKKWGYPDGSIKNFITQYREKAETYRKQVDDAVIRETMPFNVAHYRKAQ